MGLMEDILKESKVQGEVKELTDQGLSVVSTLADEQLALETQIAEQELKLEELRAQHKKISENDLPTALTDYGLSEVKLANGKKIEVKKFYGVNIKAENKEKVFKWLRDNGFGDLIKRAVSVSFGRGEDTKAQDLVADLAKRGHTVEDATGINTNTLKAFVKEQREANKTLPDEMGIFEGSIAKIK